MAVVVGLREESARFKKAAQEVAVMVAAVAAQEVAVMVVAVAAQEEAAAMAVVQEVGYGDSVISAELPACTHI